MGDIGYVWHCGQSAPDGGSVYAVKSSREAAMHWLVETHAEHIKRERENEPHRKYPRKPEDRVSAIEDMGAPAGAQFTDGCDTYYIAGWPVEDS